MGILLLTVASLLALLGLLYYFGEKKGFPYTILILLFGTIVGFILDFLGLSFLNFLSLDHDVIFYVFLPILIFEGIVNINIKHLKYNIFSILNFSTVALLLSSLLVGTGFHFLLGFDWMPSLLFGALISATDPVAVVGIFKFLGVPKRLATITDGESLINDATAVVLFQMLLGYYLDSSSLTAGAIGLKFFFVIGWALLFGIIGGYIIGKLTLVAKKNSTLVVLLSLLLAEFTFIISEQLLHLSGILTTVIAGITYKVVIDNKLGYSTEHDKHSFWEFFSFLGNSFLFFLLGLYVATLHFSTDYLFLIPVAILITLVARAISVYFVSYYINKSTKEEMNLPLSWQHILNVGGLRGAIAVAVVFHLAHYLESSLADQFIVLVFSIVLFTSLINPYFVKFIISKYGLNKLNLDDDLELLETKLLIKEKVYLDIKRASELKDFGTKYMSEILTLNKELISTIKDFSKTNIIQETLLLQCLSLEQKVFKKLHSNNEIDENAFLSLYNTTEKQIEKIEYHTYNLVEEKSTKVRPISRDIHELTLDIYLEVLKRISQKKYLEVYTGKLKNNYQIYTSRLKATEEVLKFLKDTDNKFIESIRETKIYIEILKRYKEFNKNAKIKLKKLKETNLSEVTQFEKLLQLNLVYKKELRELQKLFEKGIVKGKIYSAIEKELLEKKKENFKSVYNL